MPRKIRELKKLLSNAGFYGQKGKGSHTNWTHPNVPTKVTISGNDGSDAQRYQEKLVATAIMLSKVNP
jgi:predicted RNA binding protein YcfA (HicA-like mRNA interferase family)